MNFKNWLEIDKIIPLLTILGSGTALILSWIGVLNLSLPESIIIGLMTLLSVDALTERLTILKRIEDKIDNKPSLLALKTRLEMEKLNEYAESAIEFYVVAVNGSILFSSYLSFFEEKAKNGLKIRALILNPNGKALDIWKLISAYPDIKERITSTISLLKTISLEAQSENQVQLRLNQAFIPYSAAYVKLPKDEKIIIEFYTYKRAVDSKPHLVFSKSKDKHWFHFYYDQIEQIWEDSKDHEVDLTKSE